LLQLGLVATDTASLGADVRLGLHVSNDFHEAHAFHISWDGVVFSGVSISFQHGCTSIASVTSTARTLGRLWRSRLLGFTSGLITLQFALWLGARRWLLAFPVALGLFAHRRADRLRGDARRTAVRWRANGFALRAIVLLAHVLRATNVALRLVAVNSALSAGGLFALDLALGTFADWMTFGRANRIIALPSALRVAISRGFQEARFSCNGSDEQCNNGNEEKRLHGW